MSTTTLDGIGDATNVDSWELVHRVQQGDKNAFHLLYLQHASAVRSFLLSRTSDIHATEDLTSETFLRAMRCIGSLTYQGKSFRSWLLVIAGNLLRDQVKSSRFRNEMSCDISKQDLVVEPGPEERVLARLGRIDLRDQLDQLSEDQRTCLILRFQHELSVQETADRLGRTPTATRALQYRALRRLGVLLSLIDVD